MTIFHDPARTAAEVTALSVTLQLCAHRLEYALAEDVQDAPAPPKATTPARPRKS